MVNNIFYQVGDKKTLSRIEALDLANGQVDKVKFSFQEHLYNTADWTKEPATPFTKMLETQCKKLKDQYEYLALWYSGGWDSQTILQTFIDLNIPLDEIVIYKKSFWAEGDEVVAAIDYANKVKNEIFPNMKVTVFHMTEQHHIPYYTDKDWRWIYHPGWFPNFTKTHRRRFISGEYGIHADQTKNYVAIQGYEKPFLTVENNKWYISFPDQWANWMIDSPGYNFFCPEDNADIMIKQAWSVISWLEKLPKSVDIVDLINHVQTGRNYKDIPQMYSAWSKATGRTNTLDKDMPLGKSLFKPAEKVNGIEWKLPAESIAILNQIQNSKEFEVYKQGLEYVMKYSNCQDALNIPVIFNSNKYYIKDVEH